MQSLLQEYSDGGNQFKKQKAIICCNNKPLVPYALFCLKNNIPFDIIGQNFAEDLIRHIKDALGVEWGYKTIGGRQKKVSTPNVVAIDRLADDLLYYQELKQKEAEGKVAKQKKYKEIQDTTEAIIPVLEYLEAAQWENPQIPGKILKTSDDFAAYLRSLLKGLEPEKGGEDLKKYQEHTNEENKRKRVTLTTGHKSKGLQFEEVFIPRLDLLGNFASAPAFAEIPRRLLYVMMTRAEHGLHLLKTPTRK
jgi:superfamily I DNA/RNA helicase